MTAPRLRSESNEFPTIRANGLVCYIEIDADGKVSQLRYTEELELGLQRAKAGFSKVYAAWPGQYRTDLFLLDNL